MAVDEEGVEATLELVVVLTSEGGAPMLEEEDDMELNDNCDRLRESSP